MGALLGRAELRGCRGVSVDQVDPLQGCVRSLAVTMGLVGVAAVEQAMAIRDPRQPREVGGVGFGGVNLLAQLRGRYQLTRIRSVPTHHPQGRLLVLIVTAGREERAAQERHQLSVVAQLDPGHVAGVDDGLALAGGLVPNQEVAVLNVRYDCRLADCRTHRDDRHRILCRLCRRRRRGGRRVRWRRGRS